MSADLDRRTFLALLGIESLALLLSSSVCRAEEKAPVPGALLLAEIRTPPFRDSVVLLFEHGPRGSLGLIVNKSDHRSLGHLMAQLNLRFRDRATFERLAESEVLYGGPVARDQSLSLIHTPPGKWTPAWTLGQVGITSAPEMLRDLAAGTAEVKEVVACLGLSGWAPGQLGTEMAGGSWRVIYPAPEALPGLLFDTPLRERFEKARTLPEGLPLSIPRQMI